MGGSFACFCGKMCYELWHGAWRRRESGLAKPQPERPTPDPKKVPKGWDIIYNVNVHFAGGPTSPYELGDYDAWGHQVRILEDIDDFADRDKWEAVE